jgi:hypothetical protein
MEEAPMRKSLSLAAFAAVFAVGSAVQAQQPLNPYEAPPADAQTDQPINPYGFGYQETPPAAYPAPPAYGYQPPSAGVGRPQSNPPSYQQGYYLYPGPNQPPVYYAPPPSLGYRSLDCAQVCARRAPRKWDGVRRFSLGAHATILGLNQKVGTSDLNLYGAGFQLRIRSMGRFGFEASQSFLRATHWNGGFERNSYPFQLSLMLYIFKNEDSRHFNIYGLAGVGVMPDSVKVRFSPGDFRSQDFLEWEGHIGLGAELRFKWFAIEGDVRGIGLLRDNSDKPALYYQNIEGGPIPEKSLGLAGNLYVSLWF